MRSFFTTHPVMKTISLIMAFGLWLLVRGEQHDERRYQIPVQVTNPPVDLMIAEDVEPMITIELAGSRTRLPRLEEGYFKPYVIDLSDAAMGVNTYWITEEKLRIPRATEITRVSPNRIRVVLERAEVRMVPVEPRFVGEPEEGAELMGYQVQPPQARVRGPRTELTSLRSLRTEPISLRGHGATFEDTVGFSGLAPHWQTDVSQVRVRVEIERKAKAPER